MKAGRRPTLEMLAERLAAAPTTGAMWAALVEFASSRGFRRVSYHHYAEGEPHRPGAGLDLIAEGFPQEWVCRYLSARLFAVDPIPVMALARAQPFLWSQAAEVAPVAPEGLAYLAELEAADLGDGLALAVFGPAGRDGYVGLGWGGPALRQSAAGIAELQAAAQMGHLAYCARVDSSAVDLRQRLSPREREVLDWIARGKTNTDIAVIMGLSRHTVGTLVRRIFAKLGVHDRVSAALRGLGAGVVGGFGRT
jgi:DNA-binding CsgD family transcriptional regulator